MAGLPPEIMNEAAQLSSLFTSVAKSDPSVSFRYQLDQLYYSCNVRLRELGCRFEALTDDLIEEEMNLIQNHYLEQFRKIGQ